MNRRKEPPNEANGGDAFAAMPNFADVEAALAQSVAERPPDGVRAHVLDAAGAVPRPRPPFDSDPVRAYRRLAADFAAVAERVGGEQWQHHAVPYAWTVHGLVAHLLQIERYCARVLASPAPLVPVGDEVDHLTTGEADIAAEVLRPPSDTLADWRAAAAAVDALLSAPGGVDLEREVQFHQWPFRVRSLLVARAFELWTHADDIRRALGEPVVDPPVDDRAVMAAASVESLWLAVHVVSRSVPDASARVVLTGAGGGAWDMTLGSGGPRAATVVVDVVDYCRVASSRLAIDDLDATFEGDAALGRDLLRAATIIAV